MVAVLAREDLAARLEAASVVGMTTAVWAGVQPDRVAVYNPDGSGRTFGALNANANRIVRLLRQAGLKPGDAVALLMSNRAEFIEVLAATLRGGFRVTPVNWHLNTDEIAYILNDCEAKALFAEAKIATAGPAAALAPNLVVKLSVGGELEGFTTYDAALSGLDGSDIDDPVLGNQMLYTSGTTGRPKGVYRASPVVTPQAMYALRGYDETSVQMCAGPAYHAAPLAFDVRTSMGAGCPLVFMDKWDSEHILATIAERRVTHMHLVPIMFQRLLALPAQVKAKYDVTSVKYIVHGAAPCPPEVKFAMIEWFGPVLSEYYAGSEGGAGFTIDLGRVAAEAGLGRQETRTAAAPRSSTSRAMSARRTCRGRSITSSRPAAASPTTRTRRRPRPAASATSSPWATWGTSTTTGTCSSPAGAPRRSSPAA